jgi:4-aminobutyrate---pyruvate transaminase
VLADEIICGFGRTGSWFGSETFGIQPDMMACAKGLSSGYAPISCVIVHGRVFETLQRHSGKTGGFGHGFTYSGHPLSAAVALEALAIYEDMDLPSRARQLGDLLHRELAALRAHPLVGDVRGIGFIAGIELVADKASRQPFAAEMAIGAQVERATRAHGLIVRAMGDVIALSPPYIMDDAQVVEMVATLARALDDVARQNGLAPGEA